MKNVNLLGYCFAFLLALGCGAEAPRIKEIGPAANRLHLIPFQCSYLGVQISELEGCSIACPGRVFAEHDLSVFTASLECTHSYYEHLQCKADR